MQVIHKLSTGHQLQVEKLFVLGQESVKIVGDIVEGDGLERICLKAEEMDALINWWLSQKTR